jgi:hypothetical protein
VRSHSNNPAVRSTSPVLVQFLPRFVCCLFLQQCKMSHAVTQPVLGQFNPTRLSTAYKECEKVNFTTKSFINTRFGLFSEQRPGTCIGEERHLSADEPLSNDVHIIVMCAHFCCVYLLSFLTSVSLGGQERQHLLSACSQCAAPLGSPQQRL